mmetsp:Transcript_12845/g.37738  ORF Transcript_12845/g.37738 Transcript_12845/m.37738 type:complete len:119 (-) Transcript_12845:275-631(-)
MGHSSHSSSSRASRGTCTSTSRQSWSPPAKILSSPTWVTSITSSLRPALDPSSQHSPWPPTNRISSTGTSGHHGGGASSSGTGGGGSASRGGNVNSGTQRSGHGGSSVQLSEASILNM